MSGRVLTSMVRKRAGYISGPGYIGGDPPDGLITDSGTPVAKRLLLIHAGSATVVDSTISDPVTGEYRFSPWEPGEEFFVVMIETSRTQQDQIKGRIRPKPF